MKIKILLCCITSLCLPYLGGNVIQAQNGAKKTLSNSSVVGTVVDSKTHDVIPYATVRVENTTIGTVSDANGNFTIKNLPKGSYTLVASSVGYAESTAKAHIESGHPIHVDLYLDPQPVGGDEIVVTSSRTSELRRLAPSLVTVLPAEMFAKTNSQNLSQGLRFLPGLRIEDNCQNCGFNQVRINGLQGQYSQVLIDSRPIFSALNGVYGLEQIPSNMIERVEVIRGGGSAIFGSNAVGGVINVITKEPMRNTATVDYTLSGVNSSKGQFNDLSNVLKMNASLLTDDRSAGVTLFGQYSYRPPVDIDGDGFSEVPNLRNRSFGFNAFYKPTMRTKLKAEFHTTHEYRRGGDRFDFPPFEAQIAEFLQHFINGGSLTFDYLSPNAKHKLQVYLAGQHIERKSYYGGGNFVDSLLKMPPEDARTPLMQYGETRDLTGQLGVQYNFQFAPKFQLTLGGEFNYDKLTDKSGYRPNPIAQKTYALGQYHQLEYKTDKISLLLGGRLDYTRLMQGGELSFNKPIYSPRANIRWTPTKNTGIRASYSAGFRAPQFFDEEMHVTLLGGDPIVRKLSPSLKEERSHSFSLSIDQYGQLGGGWSYNVMAEGFYTLLDGKFANIPSEEKDNNGNTIYYVENVDKAHVFGANLEARLAYGRLFDIQSGITLQKSQYSEPIEVDGEGFDHVMSKDYMRTPNVYGYMVATVRPVKDFSITLSGTFTGKMKVPHEATEAPEGITAKANGHYEGIVDGQKYRGTEKAEIVTTKPFADMDLKMAYDFHLSQGILSTVKFGVQNMFNSYQKDTDQGPGRASTYIYGPMLPRRVYIGVAVTI